MGQLFLYMEDGIERSMSMLIQEAEQKKQTGQKPLIKVEVESPKVSVGWPPKAAFQQVHPVGLSLPTDRNASSYPLTTDTTHLTNTNSGS